MHLTEAGASGRHPLPQHAVSHTCNVCCNTIMPPSHSAAVLSCSVPCHVQWPGHTLLPQPSKFTLYSQSGEGSPWNPDAGRSVILSCNGQRTMRTCLEGAARLLADELATADFEGAKWAFFSAYSLYGEGLLPRAFELAKQVKTVSSRVRNGQLMVPRGSSTWCCTTCMVKAYCRVPSSSSHM